jgi:hypothetical protein
MKYYHVAEESAVQNIYSKGITPDTANKIILIVLSDSFIMKKFLFDVYAHEVLKTDTYCAFEIDSAGVTGPLSETEINSIFADSFKSCKIPFIERKYVKPFKSEESYEGMGLMEGVFPVENKDKFTDSYKRKVLEYLKEVDA